MSAEAFMAALKAPDDHSSHEKLYTLATKGPVASAALPTVATLYLKAFCDSNLSVVRRRWMGLSLSRMLKASTEVAARLKSLDDELVQVGNVVLVQNGEAEETRVVAGLIIREALARGIPFRNFWRDPNALNNEPAFPKTINAEWMSGFQGFVDSVAKAFINPFIIYAVSIVASDGYRWCGEASPILFAENDCLTIITPEASLQHIEFIDVPLRHVESITRRRSQLHDSQNLQTEHEPWDTIIKLKTAEWTYCVNSSERKGESLTIMVEHESDAMECEGALKSFIKSSSVDNSASCESIIDYSQSASRRQPNRNSPVSVSEGASSSTNMASVTSPLPLIRVNRELRHKSARNTQKENKDHLDGGLPLGGTSTTTNMISVTSPLHLSQPKVRQVVESEQAHEPTQTTQRKAGALPVIQKASSSHRAHAPPAILETDHEFDFPKQSPRIVRPVFTKDKAKSGKAIGNKPASLEGTRLITKAKPIGPKPKPRKKHAAKKDKDLILQPNRASTRASSISQARGQTSPTQTRPSSSNSVSKSTGLPKVSKPSGSQVVEAPGRRANDFDIPEEDEANEEAKGDSKSRPVRKVVKAITYTEGDMSEYESESAAHDSPGSEYAGKNTKSTRSPVKRARVTIPCKPRKTASTKTAVSRQARSSGGATQSLSIDTKKRSLLSNLVPKSQTSKRQNKKSKTNIRKSIADKENAPPVADVDMDETPSFPCPTMPSSEINVLQKLNHQQIGVTYDHSHGRENAEPRKRPLDDGSPPLTPRSKRARKDHAGVTQNFSAKAPPRVLEDPSSPCGRQQRLPSTQSIWQQGHNMQPPPQPKAEHEKQVAPRTQRQRSGINGRTPMQQSSKRSHSGNSSNVELLSSNSKPTPASPNAESTAISGHADPRQVTMAKEIAESEIAKSDPFQRSEKIKITAFTRRLTGEKTTAEDFKHAHSALQPTAIELVDSSSSSDAASRVKVTSMPPQQPGAPRKGPGVQVKEIALVPITVERPTKRYTSRASEPVAPTAPIVAEANLNVEMSDYIRKPTHQMIETTQLQGAQSRDENMGIDGDTLVENDDEQLPEAKGAPWQLQSSPPLLDNSPSSHSSTSAEPEPRTEPRISTSEAEELEWEASLQPHQRNLQEQFIRVSNRLLRHIVDNDTAVNDIADTYQSDGLHSLQNLAVRHDGEIEAMSKEMNKKTGSIKTCCDQLLKKLFQEQKEAKNLDF